MSTGRDSRFPRPDDSRQDVSQATAFLVVLFLLIGVAAALFFGNAWIFAPITTQSLALRGSAQPVLALSLTTGSGGQPTIVAPPPVKPLAAIAVKTSPTSTTNSTVTPIPTLPTPHAIATPASGVQIATVGNTNGDGVFLRAAPRLSDKLSAWPDRTRVQLLGAEAVGDGQHWVKVQTSNGQVGWIPAQYLLR